MSPVARTVVLVLGAALSSVVCDRGDGISDGMPAGDGIGDSPLSPLGGGDDGQVSQGQSFTDSACACIGAEDKRSFGWQCHAWPAGPASFSKTSPVGTELTPWCYVAADCPSKVAVGEETGDLRSIPETFPHWPHVYVSLGCQTKEQQARSRAMDELALMHELALEGKKHGSGVGSRGDRGRQVTPPPTPFPTTIDKTLLMKDFYDAYFRPHGGFKYARGEQGACLADKALHLMDMLSCTAANLAQLPPSSVLAQNTPRNPGAAGEGGNAQCSGAFVDKVSSAARECCSGLEHLPTWDTKKSCETDIAPAMSRLQGMAHGLRQCVSWLAQNSRAEQSLGDAASPAVCAHALFALPGAVNALFFAVHRRMAFDTSEEGDPIFGMAHVWQTRRFVIACAPKIMEPKTHNELMTAAFSHECRHMVNKLWQGLRKQSAKRDRQARKDEELSRRRNEAAARKRIAAQERARAAYRRSTTPAPTPQTACPPGFRNIWSKQYHHGEQSTSEKHFECVREMKPHKQKLRTTTSPTPKSPPTTTIGPTPAATPAPTPMLTMKPHFQVLQQDDDVSSIATTTTSRPTLAPHKQKPTLHKELVALTASPAAPTVSGNAALRGGSGKRKRVTFVSAADAAAAAQHTQTMVALDTYASGNRDDDDDFQ